MRLKLQTSKLPSLSSHYTFSCQNIILQANQGKRKYTKKVKQIHLKYNTCDTKQIQHKYTGSGNTKNLVAGFQILVTLLSHYKLSSHLQYQFNFYIQLALHGGHCSRVCFEIGFVYNVAVQLVTQAVSKFSRYF